MPSDLIYLRLVGAVALLLWGLHMVQSGILRGYGSGLRKALGAFLKNPLKAFLAGLGVTAALQSSTATGLMVASFAASGMIALVPALVVMLGANVGTTLIVQVLSFDVADVAPFFLVGGYLAFHRGRRTRTRETGRCAIGLGLMLLALRALVHDVDLATHAPEVTRLIGALGNNPFLAVPLGAVLAWAAHSSVAVVLLIMSLTASYVITPAAAIALVAGANLGTAINPVLESTANGAARRLPVGNLINRAIGCLLVVPLAGALAPLLERIEPNLARQVADFHTLFNIVMALLFAPFLHPFARLLERLFPDRGAGVADLAKPLYLDRAAIASPPAALARATHEVLRLADMVETMLTRAMDALRTGSREAQTDVQHMGEAVETLHEAIKLYVTEVTRDTLDEADARRAMEIVTLTINLEQIADIVDKNLLDLAVRKADRGLKFSPEGAADLESFYKRVMGGMKPAMEVFTSGDVEKARALLSEKTRVREAERIAEEAHLARLRDDRQESIETSSMHLNVLRDLKRVHSHLCSAAYPVLESAGELTPSRLRERRPAPAPGAFHGN